MDLDNMLAYKVAMLSANLSESLSLVYAVYGLTMPQWRVMATLGASMNTDENFDRLTHTHLTTMTAKQLVGSTQLDKVTITRALQQLERDGLIGKAPCDKDRRAVIVSLTDKGRQVYSQIIPEVVKWQKEKLSNITDSEYVLFKKVIDRLMT